MATVKEVRNTIKSHQYISDSIAYILSPENPSGNEKCFQATFLNCVDNGIAGLSDQFYEIRRVFNKDSDILAHHYIQSFSPNEKITPELVHQIGAELAQKMAPGFQVIVSTHVDKDHLHNHILINSVSFETGLKWKGNGATLNAMRSESDKLCRQYGLTTIDRHSGFRGIDQATQKLAEKGESWKVELCRVLDEAVMMCNTKNEFYAYMKRKGFEITRYTDRHITFQKIGETKKIRANTLAEQFGKDYTKERLEIKMGFYRTPKPLENPPTPKPPVPFVSEFEKIERRHFEDNPPPLTPSEGKAFSQKIKKSHNPFFLLLRVLRRLRFRQDLRAVLDAKYERLHKRVKKQSRYKTKEPDLRTILERYDKKPAIAGNISYKDLVNSQGDNFRVRLNLSAVPKLYAYPFFFSARLYSNSFHFMTEWWKQLYGESEGKDGRGIFPAGVDNTTDLHSMGQYIQDGKRMLFETVVVIDKARRSFTIPNDPENLDGLNFLSGMDMNEVNLKAMQGTVLAHVDGKVPNLIIHVPELNEYWLGQLIYFFEKACGISGYLNSVNPFNQPGVEAYKKNMFALLGKPGYEAEKKALEKRLKNK